MKYGAGAPKVQEHKEVNSPYIRHYKCLKEALMSDIRTLNLLVLL